MMPIPHTPERSSSQRSSSNRLYTTLLASLTVSMMSITAIMSQAAIADETPKTPTEEIIPPVPPTTTIMLGRSLQHHYMVIIPVASLTNSVNTSPQFTLLQKIRTIAPQAFLTRHHLGDYIYVGGFDRFGPAQKQVTQIQRYFANARIVYFP